MSFEPPPSNYCDLNPCCYVYSSANGTWTPFSSTVSTNPQCQCPFEGNSDIAGPGVLAAFIVTAWITCFVAGIDAYCGLSKRLSTHLSDPCCRNRVENFENLVQTNVPFRGSQSSFLQFVNYLFSKGVVSILRLFEKESPRTRKVAQSSLDILCDIQVVTGTAIMIAGIVQRDSLTFYHQQFVMTYWFLTLNSFWAARSGRLQSDEEDDDDDDDNEWHYWTRLLAIFITTVLSIYYQLVTITQQNSEWDPLTSGFCYITHDKSDYQQNFFWIAGLIIFVVYILLILLAGLIARLTGSNKTWMDSAGEWTSERQKIYHQYYKDWRFSELNILQSVEEFGLDPLPVPAGTAPSGFPQAGSHSGTLTPRTRPRFTNNYQQYAARAALNIPFIVEWAFLRFFALWAWGDDSSITIVLALFGFAAWNTYDLIDYKLSNADLVTNESDWGFGQILPMALLGLILLQILDSIQDARKESKKVVDSDSGSFCGSVVDASTNDASVTAHDLVTSSTMIQILHDGTRYQEMDGGY